MKTRILSYQAKILAAYGNTFRRLFKTDNRIEDQMSDGMSDANALGRLDSEAMDAAYDLAEALRAAREGNRGYRPELYDLTRRMNAVLQRAGWTITFTGEP